MFGAVPSPRTNFRNEIFVNVCVRAVRICCSCFVFDRLILYLCRAGEQMLPFISCAGWQIWPRVCMHAKCINLHFALWWNKCFLQRSVIFSNAGVRAIAELFRIAICKCDSILYKLNSNAVFFLFVCLWCLWHGKLRMKYVVAWLLSCIISKWLSEFWCFAKY